ncbi:hypothetical protein C8R43DRAFT_1126944 [Mycena crocata]|nr:hypothetical protein C8R43DRAFT_1126944 [Mycena crocata]
MEIPQELIDAILYEVESPETLKTCSLVSQSFCGTSQRILFRSLGLDDDYPTKGYGPVSSLLAESSHLAPYVTRLSICVSLAHIIPSEARMLEELLGKLVNVRRCTIEGAPAQDPPSWADLAPLTSTLLEFVGRQNLDTLHIVYLAEVPGSVLALFVSSAATVSFYGVRGSNDVHNNEFSEDSAAAKLQKLLLIGSNSVGEILVRPPFASRIAKLRKLGLRADPELNAQLISAAASTLEHIHFSFSSVYPCFLVDGNFTPFPPLPRLNSVDLTFQHDDAEYPQFFLDSLSSLIIAVPRSIAEITITHRLLWPVRFVPPFLLPAITSEIDRLVTDDIPPIRWRVCFECADEGQHARRFSDFAHFMQTELPRLCERRKLIVEWCVSGGDVDEWTWR